MGNDDWKLIRCVKCGNKFRVPKKDGQIPPRKYRICGTCWSKTAKQNQQEV